MGKISKMKVLGLEIVTIEKNDLDFISLTDIAKYRGIAETDDVIKNWMRNKSTIEFLGLWEKINNSSFKPVEFDGFRSEAGSNHFVLSPSKWIKQTNAIGLYSRQGRGGGTFAHKDIAFEFASWISAEFKLYLIKEFQRLKLQESEKLVVGWDAKRFLAKVNYKVHTDAVKEHLIPRSISQKQASFIYADEADILNMALFCVTAKEWREKHPDNAKEDNIRDHADVSQLVCLAGLESLNAEFIRQGMTPAERLKRLNQIAIVQMKSILQSPSIKQLEDVE